MTNVLHTLVDADESIQSSKNVENGEVDPAIVSGAIQALETLPLEYLTQHVRETRELLEGLLAPECERNSTYAPKKILETVIEKMRLAESIQLMQMRSHLPKSRQWVEPNHQWDGIERSLAMRESLHVTRIASGDKQYARDQRIIMQSMGIHPRENSITRAQENYLNFIAFSGKNYAGHFFVEKPYRTPQHKLILHTGIHAAVQDHTAELIAKLLQLEEFKDTESIRTAPQLRFQWLVDGLIKNGFRPDRQNPVSHDHFGEGELGDDAVLMTWPPKVKAKISNPGPHRLTQYFPASAHQNEQAK